MAKPTKETLNVQETRRNATLSARCLRKGRLRTPSPKLAKHTANQRSEAIKRRDAGETLAAIDKSYGVDLSMISRL